MRCVFLVVGFAVFALATVRIDRAEAEPAEKKAASTSEPTKNASPAVDRSADEKAIRENVSAFIKAYNDRKSDGIAALFLPEGQVITEEGEIIEGREAIKASFNHMFAEGPDATMDVVVDSIRFIGSDLAVEVGSTKETPAPGETPDFGRYTVLHVKRDGKWLMALARDTQGEPPTSHERLQPLAWLVGEWVDDGGSSIVSTSCRWSDDKNFLLQDINLRIAGQDAMQVTQRIGWDPLGKRIRSWAFDTEGGFAEGVWAHNGNSWVIKSTGVSSDGTAASATSEIVPTGTDGYVWRVRDRVVGEEIQPEVEVKVVRKAPEPEN